MIEVVHFAVGNEIFVRRILREVGKLQVMEISCVCIFGVLLIPEVLEDKGICSRQSLGLKLEDLRLVLAWVARAMLPMLRSGTLLIEQERFGDEMGCFDLGDRR